MSNVRRSDGSEERGFAMRGMLICCVAIVVLGCTQRVDRHGLITERRKDSPMYSWVLGTDAYFNSTLSEHRRWRYAGSADGYDHLVYGVQNSSDYSFQRFAVRSEDIELPTRMSLTSDESQWVSLAVVQLDEQRAYFRVLTPEEIRIADPAQHGPFQINAEESH